MQKSKDYEMIQKSKDYKKKRKGKDYKQMRKYKNHKKMKNQRMEQRDNLAENVVRVNSNGFTGMKSFMRIFCLQPRCLIFHNIIMDIWKPDVKRAYLYAACIAKHSGVQGVTKTTSDCETHVLKIIGVWKKNLCYT